MQSWLLLELYIELRAAELNQRKGQRLPPSRASFWAPWRQRLAQGLVALGLRIDADASRAAVRSPEPAPHLNGSDA